MTKFALVALALIATVAIATWQVEAAQATADKHTGFFNWFNSRGQQPENVAPKAAAKKKVAVLGAGISGMAAVASLIRQPHWQEVYDVDVYTLGWRIGGKGATGREVNTSYRILEHGMHTFFGLYHTAFEMYRDIYVALHTAGESLEYLPAFDDAFVKAKQSVLAMQDPATDEWYQFASPNPTTNNKPGLDAANVDPPPQYGHEKEFGGKNVHKANERSTVVSPSRFFAERQTSHDMHFSSPAHLIGSLTKKVFVPVASEAVSKMHPKLKHAEGSFAHELSGALLSLQSNLDSAQHGFLSIEESLVFLQSTVKKLKKMMGLMGQPKLDPAFDPKKQGHSAFKLRPEDVFCDFSLELCRDVMNVYWFADYMKAMLKGVFEDEVLIKGFRTIDEWEWVDWLKHHGVSNSTANSPLVAINYHMNFAFRDGNFDTPSIAAGGVLMSVLHLWFDWAAEGGMMYRFASGMADVLFAPLYMLATKQGVNFHFFSKILNLETDGKNVTGVLINQQATTINNATYQPLLDCPKFHCWPSTPFYEQLNEAAALQDGHYDLESYYDRWPGVYNYTLKQGQDFDAVILAIPVAAHRVIAQELMAASPAYNAMVENIATVSTISLQLWFTNTTKEMGWTHDDFLNLIPYATPLDSISEMSQVTDTEVWNCTIGSVVYFCGVIPSGVPPPPSDWMYPIEQKAYTKEIMLNYLATEMGWVLPLAANTTDPRGLNWTYVTNCKPNSDNFDSQYYRANVDHSERYTLSLPGTSKYRLWPDQSGFDNLFLSGDWTGIISGLEVGCAEAATESGDTAAMGLVRWLNYPSACPLTGGVVVAPLIYQRPPSKLGGAHSYTWVKDDTDKAPGATDKALPKWDKYHHFSNVETVVQQQIKHFEQSRQVKSAKQAKAAQVLETQVQKEKAQPTAAGKKAGDVKITAEVDAGLSSDQFASLSSSTQDEFLLSAQKQKIRSKLWSMLSPDAASKLAMYPEALLTALEEKLATVRESLKEGIKDAVHDLEEGIAEAGKKIGEVISDGASAVKRWITGTPYYTCPIYNATAPARSAEAIYSASWNYNREWWYYGGNVVDENNKTRSVLMTMERLSVDLEVGGVVLAHNITNGYSAMLQVTDAECGQLFGGCWATTMEQEYPMRNELNPWRMRLNCTIPVGKVWTWELVQGELGQPGSILHMHATVHDRLNRDLTLDMYVTERSGMQSNGYGADAYSPKILTTAQNLKVINNGDSIGQYLNTSNDPMACQGSYYDSSLATQVLQWEVKSNNRTVWSGHDGSLRFDKEVYGKNPTFPEGMHVEHLWAWIHWSDNTVLSTWHVMANDPTGYWHDTKYAKLFNLTNNEVVYEWPMDQVEWSNTTTGWLSPATNQTYAWKWDVRLTNPDTNLDYSFTLYPEMLNMELAFSPTTAIWEGGMWGQGTKSTGEIIEGYGYMEVNYILGMA